MKINRESVAIKGIERTIIDEAYDNGWVKPKYPATVRTICRLLGVVLQASLLRAQLHGLSSDLFERPQKRVVY